MKITEAEKLETKVTATISFGFGQICDSIEELLKDRGFTENIENILVLEMDQVEKMEIIRGIVNAHLETISQFLVKETRKRGNDSIRSINYHLEQSTILEKHPKRAFTPVPRPLSPLPRKGDDNGC